MAPHHTPAGWCRLLTASSHHRSRGAATAAAARLRCARLHGPAPRVQRSLRRRWPFPRPPHVPPRSCDEAKLRHALPGRSLRVTSCGTHAAGPGGCCGTERDSPRPRSVAGDWRESQCRSHCGCVAYAQLPNCAAPMGQAAAPSGLSWWEVGRSSSPGERHGQRSVACNREQAQCGWADAAHAGV